jgi:diguanylate cyclase (GGDEF)-like protein
MRYAADHDALTQILSRRGLLNRGQAAISRAIEARAPVALLMLDIDYFKTVNDSHGHVAGDAVLVEFARRVGAVLDDDCIFGRLGGEEFAVIVPGADERTAFFMAERIRNAVASEAISTGEGLSIEISTSIGVATAKAGVATSLDRLLARADGALYGAKSPGRNRVLAAA